MNGVGLFTVDVWAYHVTRSTIAYSFNSMQHTMFAPPRTPESLSPDRFLRPNQSKYKRIWRSAEQFSTIKIQLGLLHGCGIRECLE